MSGLGAYWQAKQLGMSDGMATGVMIQAQNRAREDRELLEEQNALLRNQQNAANARLVAEDRADRERRDAIAAEEAAERERLREEKREKERAEEKAEKERRAQIAKDLITKLQKLFTEIKAQHPDIEEASGSLQDLAALHTSRTDSGSAINVDLWIKAGQLEKLIKLIEPLEDSLSIKSYERSDIIDADLGFVAADQLEKFNTLKEKIPVFISYHAEQGAIPAEPLVAFRDEVWNLIWKSWLLEGENPWHSLEFSCLKNQEYWCPNSGYHKSLELVCPEPEFVEHGKLVSTKSDFIQDSLPIKKFANELKSLAMGGWHCVGLNQTGVVYGWGQDWDEQTMPDVRKRKNDWKEIREQAEKGELHKRSASHTNIVNLNWSPDGTRYATTSYDEIKICEPNGKEKIVVEKDQYSLRMAQWSPDGRYLACFHVDPKNSVLLWDIEKEAFPLEYKFPLEHNSLLERDEDRSIAHVVWSPKKNQLAIVGKRSSSSWDRISLWEINTGEKTFLSSGISEETLWTIDADGTVISLSWSPDGERFATCVVYRGSYKNSNTIYIYDVSTGEKTLSKECKDGFEPVRVSWCPDGSKIAIGSSRSQTGTVRFINSTDGEEILELDSEGKPLLDSEGKPKKLEFNGTLSTGSWSPDGKLLATAVDFDNSKVLIRAFDDKDQTTPYTIPQPPHNITWSPDGLRLAGGAMKAKTHQSK